MSDKNIERLLLIDGYGFIFRAYYSLPALNNPEGKPVGALYGFISMITKLIDVMKFSHIALIFDSGKKNFRHDISDNYKSNRPETPDDLKQQFHLIREAALALNIISVEKLGFEADDIIATYSKLAVKSDLDVTIISSDKDLTQLISDKINMYDPLKNKYITRDEVKEKFGIYPEQVVDYLSLVGDASDNISGVPTIGPKTASDLLNEFGSLENIYNNLEKISQSKKREKLSENYSMAILSKKLLILEDKIENLPDLQDLKLKKIDQEILIKFLEKHNFKSLITKFNKKFQNIEKAEISSQLLTNNIDSLIKITNIEEIEKISDNIIKLGYIDFLIFYSLEEIHICAFRSENNYYYFTRKSQENFPELLEKFIQLLESDYISKITYNVKKFLSKINRSSIYAEDMMIMSYIAENGKHSHELTDIIEFHVSNKPKELAEFITNQRKKPDLDNLNNEEIGEYIISYLKWVKPVYESLKKLIINDKNLYIYESLDKNMINILNKMESIGIKADSEYLENLSIYFTKKIEKLEEEIFRIVGYIFNIASPKQLGEIIFDKLKLGEGKKSKSGAYSTDISVLEELSYKGHVIADFIIEWRQLSKLKSTYSDALQNQINSITKRIHTNFNLCTTSTGRLSSVDPNLQNIPIRTEEGNKIRSAFIPEPGNLFLSADYSQIELRILAHIANIDNLKEAFAENKDIHIVTASQIFGVKEEAVTNELRRSAKTINFSIIYGISGFGLAKRLAIDRKSASNYIEAYFKKYPGIEDYMEKTKKFAREQKYVTNLFGRRLYIKDINNSNSVIRSFSERAAINAPIQSTASDIIKKAMIKIDLELKSSNIDAKMILQVHDELLFEVREEDIEKLVKLVKNSMEDNSYNVPMTIDISIGKNWGSLEEYKEQICG